MATLICSRFRQRRGFQIVLCIGLRTQHRSVSLRLVSIGFHNTYPLSLCPGWRSAASWKTSNIRENIPAPSMARLCPPQRYCKRDPEWDSLRCRGHDVRRAASAPRWRLPPASLSNTVCRSQMACLCSTTVAAGRPVRSRASIGLRFPRAGLELQLSDRAAKSLVLGAERAVHGSLLARPYVRNRTTQKEPATKANGRLIPA
jgi:hypothetical protein